MCNNASRTYKQKQKRMQKKWTNVQCLGVDLSIVLPCYREAPHLYKNVALIRRILETRLSDVSYEIILVNDGSPDNTDLKCQRLSSDSSVVKSISYSKNQWKGNAVKLGVLAAEWKVMCFMDSDLDISPKFIIEYYQYLESHQNLDVIIGSKAVSISKSRVSLKRKIFSFVSKSVNSILFWLPIKDTQVGIKMFRKKVGKDIFPLVSINGYAFDVEFLFHSHIHGYKIEERAVELKIEDKTSSIDFYSTLRILYDLFLLFKKTNYVYILRKKELRLKTKIRIFLLRIAIFPSERVVAMLLKIIRNPKVKKDRKILTPSLSQI